MKSLNINNSLIDPGLASCDFTNIDTKFKLFENKEKVLNNYNL